MLTKKALWVNNKRFVRKVMPISPHAPKTRVEEDYAKLLAAKRENPGDDLPCLDLILDLAPGQRIMALSEPKL